MSAKIIDKKRAKVILLQDIKNLGQKDEIKEVTFGYARNFLIPQKLAILVLPQEIKRLEEIKKIKRAQQEKVIEKAEELKKKLEKIAVEIKAKVDEKGKLFGSIGRKEVIETLKERGIEIDKKRIEMEEPIKEIGEHWVRVRLGEDIEMKMKIIVLGAGKKDKNKKL